MSFGSSYEFVDPLESEIPQSALGLIDESFAREHSCIPVGFDGESLLLAVSESVYIDQSFYGVLERLRFTLNRDIKLEYAEQEKILAAIDTYYGRRDLEE